MVAKIQVLTATNSNFQQFAEDLYDSGVSIINQTPSSFEVIGGNGDKITVYSASANFMYFWGFPLSGNATSLMFTDNGVDHISGTGFDVPVQDLIEAFSSDDDEAVATLIGDIDFLGNSKDDVARLGDGNDRLFGYDGSDTLLGGAGNDTLYGGTGSDKMTGGIGNDTFYVTDAGDAVYEAAGEGTLDKVFASVNWTMTASQEIEQLRASYAANATVGLSLTGNNLNNALYGGALGDTLRGGAGTDNLFGLGGNDIFYVTETGDAVYEAAGNGTLDRVFASVNWIMTAGQEIEQLRANYAANATVGLSLTGNGGSNTIYGGTLGDTLRGGAGADKLYGLGGNDIFYVTDTGDAVYEAAGGGTGDRVFASVNWTMTAGQEIEGLRATYAANARIGLSLTGNAGNNAIYGATAGDTLNGGAGLDKLYGLGGKDTLTGGAGDDAFYFTTAPSAGDLDTITDFANATGNNDAIWLSRSVFTELTGSSGAVLSGSQFIANASGKGVGDQHIIYNTTTGALLYDANTSDGAAGVQFAQLGTTQNHPMNITNADFYLI